MAYNRYTVDVRRMSRPSRHGDGIAANNKVTDLDSDTAAVTLTISNIQGGAISQTATLTGDATLTTPTAAALLAEWTEMDAVDSMSFHVSNAQTGAFDVILAGGTGVTMVGSGIVVPGAGRLFTLTRSGEATFNMY